MRNAILLLPEQRTTGEQRDRAEVYLAAVSYMQVDDRAAQRALRQLRADLDGLKRHLAALRAGTTD
jgi:hypothetical protein